MMDFKVSPHFSFYELTSTSNLAILERNRAAADLYIDAGKALSWGILEPLRGSRPLRINSGFRCAELNASTAGSSVASQHRLFEAADLSRPGQSAFELFEEAVDLLQDRMIPFGQLIYEEVDRGYDVAQWVHVSLGPGYRAEAKCGQILRRIGDVWTLVKKVNCTLWTLPEPA